MCPEAAALRNRASLLDGRAGLAARVIGINGSVTNDRGACKGGTMTERRRGPGEDREDETRDEEGETRQERDAATREAVEEEERTGGPRREGDG